MYSLYSRVPLRIHGHYLTQPQCQCHTKKINNYLLVSSNTCFIIRYPQLTQKCHFTVGLSELGSILCGVFGWVRIQRWGSGDFQSPGLMSSVEARWLVWDVLTGWPSEVYVLDWVCLWLASFQKWGVDASWLAAKVCSPKRAVIDSLNTFKTSSDGYLLPWLQNNVFS